MSLPGASWRRWGWHSLAPFRISGRLPSPSRLSPPPLPRKLCGYRLLRLRQVGSWALQPPGSGAGGSRAVSVMAPGAGSERLFCDLLHQPLVPSCPFSHPQPPPAAADRPLTEPMAPPSSPPHEPYWEAPRSHRTAASLHSKAALWGVFGGCLFAPAGASLRRKEWEGKGFLE